MPAGIILAGGKSRRMGRDKALLPLPGVEQITFVQHLVTVLTPLCPEVVVVARDAMQAATFAQCHASVVTDHLDGVGPLMGLYSGLSAINATHALVTAVDMPFVQESLLSFLLSQALNEMPLVPVVDQVPQVLLAVYPRSLLPMIEKHLRAGRRDPRSLLEVVPVRFVEEAQLRIVDPQLRSFVNLNTPEELAFYENSPQDNPA